MKLPSPFMLTKQGEESKAPSCPPKKPATKKKIAKVQESTTELE